MFYNNIIPSIVGTFSNDNIVCQIFIERISTLNSFKRWRFSLAERKCGSSGTYYYKSRYTTRYEQQSRKDIHCNV